MYKVSHAEEREEMYMHGESIDALFSAGYYFKSVKKLPFHCSSPSPLFFSFCNEKCVETF